jgi:hypothetical protein
VTVESYEESAAFFPQTAVMIGLARK